MVVACSLAMQPNPAPTTAQGAAFSEFRDSNQTRIPDGIAS
jgi:hypothetical protein